LAEEAGVPGENHRRRNMVWFIDLECLTPLSTIKLYRGGQF